MTCLVQGPWGCSPGRGVLARVGCSGSQGPSPEGGFWSLKAYEAAPGSCLPCPSRTQTQRCPSLVPPCARRGGRLQGAAAALVPRLYSCGASEVSEGLTSHFPLSESSPPPATVHFAPSRFQSFVPLGLHPDAFLLPLPIASTSFQGCVRGGSQWKLVLNRREGIFAPCLQPPAGIWLMGSGCGCEVCGNGHQAAAVRAQQLLPPL